MDSKNEGKPTEIPSSSSSSFTLLSLSKEDLDEYDVARLREYERDLNILKEQSELRYLAQRKGTVRKTPSSSLGTTGKSKAESTLFSLKSLNRESFLLNAKAEAPISRRSNDARASPSSRSSGGLPSKALNPTVCRPNVQVKSKPISPSPFRSLPSKNAVPLRPRSTSIVPRPPLSLPKASPGKCAVRVCSPVSFRQSRPPTRLLNGKLPDLVTPYLSIPQPIKHALPPPPPKSSPRQHPHPHQDVHHENRRVENEYLQIVANLAKLQQLLPSINRQAHAERFEQVQREMDILIGRRTQIRNTNGYVRNKYPLPE